MKTVQYLLSGQYLSTAYDFYASGLFKNPDAAMVGTSMVSANNIYWGHLSINGSLGLFMGQLPDRLWGQIWCTPSASQGLSMTIGSIKPDVIYTVLLDNAGVLNVQASGTTIWKTPGPGNGSAGPYFAQITDDGQLTLTTGTPSNPGAQYWSSGTNQGTLSVERQTGSLISILQIQVSYLDTSSGKPGNKVMLSIGDNSKSASLHWPAMLKGPTDPNFLDSMPRALRLYVGPITSNSMQVNLGAWRSLRLIITDSDMGFPLGFSQVASA